MERLEERAWKCLSILRTPLYEGLAHRAGHAASEDLVTNSAPRNDRDV